MDIKTEDIFGNEVKIGDTVIVGGYSTGLDVVKVECISEDGRIGTIYEKSVWKNGQYIKTGKMATSFYNREFARYDAPLRSKRYR